MGGAGHHVAGVLLVAGCIGHKEGAARSRKIAIGNVDGDALLTLRLEPIEQQCVIELVSRTAEFSRILFERFDLVDWNGASLGEQATNIVRWRHPHQI
jgi:hypothetical protein